MVRFYSLHSRRCKRCDKFPLLTQPLVLEFLFLCFVFTLVSTMKKEFQCFKDNFGIKVKRGVSIRICFIFSSKFLRRNFLTRVAELNDTLN